SGNESTAVPVTIAPTVSTRARTKRAKAGPTSGAGPSARIAATGSRTMTATRASPAYASRIGTRVFGRRRARSAMRGVRVPVVKKYNMSADCTALVRSGAELLAKGGHQIG